MLRRPCGEQAPQDKDTDFPSTPLKVSSNENLQPLSSSELVISLSTPPSDPPSPATQILKRNDHSRNALCGLSDSDLQQALKADEELIRDDLSDYQGSCIWQENGF
ncbi:hypothetical protein AJ78_08817 [Emergomyces pasteurianus Ep9510]|uniref:Uncharacterized protein n=1 Tax=Emergomyces pasteurianus Ep9510 TaxID=1447872 RepID=A0A1J9Q493_9EURO|nr:hypothetical protein AJ78_08817 [Emergomyces pasteurianus Ep9510]